MLRPSLKSVFKSLPVGDTDDEERQGWLLLSIEEVGEFPSPPIPQTHTKVQFRERERERGEKENS